MLEVLGLPWGPWKVREIAEHLNISLGELIKEYFGVIIEENGEKIIDLRDELRKPCPFLKGDKSCLIYPVRPGPCEDYPIDTDFGDSDIGCPAYKKAIKAHRRKIRTKG